MQQNPQSTSDASSADRNAIGAVIDNCLCRRAAGEAISDEAVIASHPELMPALGEELRRLRVIVAAREKAAVSSDDGDDTRTHQSSASGSGRLEVRCPNCHEPTEVAVDTPLTDLTCSACGSHFSLVDQSKATRMAPSLSKMGRFELIERIGIGGFGSVWKARDKQLDRTVAIKIPRRGDMTPEEQEKFFREARAAAQLRHPSIVSVHEVGRDGESVYIVSDYVRGVTLGDWLTGQQVTSREAAQLCAKIADALHHAHEQGVVHRDLKPANIMMDGDGHPHLMDFGLARREVGEVTVTMDGQVLGTPAYMSPEQAMGEGHTADRRSDIYSLGVVLFQLLTGELPFRGNARMIMHQVIHDEPPSPRKLNGSVPKDLETVTVKCLEKEPSRRYQAARDVASDLRRAINHEPIVARPVGPITKVWKWGRRKPAYAGLASAFIGSVLVGIGATTYYATEAGHEASAAKRALAEAEKSRDQAEQINQFFVNEVMGLADLRKHDFPRIALVDALEMAARRADDVFPEEPGLLAVLRECIGQVFISVDQPKLAVEQLEKAVQLRTSLSGPSDRQTLIAKRLLGTALRDDERYEEARELLETTLAEQKHLLGAGHEDYIATGVALTALNRQSRSEEGIVFCEELYRSARDSLGAEHPLTLEAQGGLAWTLRWTGHSDSALPHAELVASSMQKVLGVDDYRTQYAKYNYCACLQDARRHDDAAKELYVLLESRKRTPGPSHRETLWTIWRLATALNDAHRSDERDKVLNEFLGTLEYFPTNNAKQRTEAMYLIADLCERIGRSEDEVAIRRLIKKINSAGRNSPRTMATDTSP